MITESAEHSPEKTHHEDDSRQRGRAWAGLALAADGVLRFVPWLGCERAFRYAVVSELRGKRLRIGQCRRAHSDENDGKEQDEHAAQARQSAPAHFPRGQRRGSPGGGDNFVTSMPRRAVL